MSDYNNASPKEKLSTAKRIPDGHGSDGRDLPSIKRRLIRPKKLRRPDEPTDSALSSPGAGPSSPRRSASPVAIPRRRSRSPESPKRHRTETESETTKEQPLRRSHLTPARSAHPPLVSCRSVYSYTRLNHIEEGTYGVVFRARCNDTGGIYALKKLKLEEEKQGFPITSLREVMALMVNGGHENVVGIREIVVGDTLNQYVLQYRSWSRYGMGGANL